MEGIVLMVLKYPEQQVMFVVHYIVQTANILLSVFRRGKSEPAEAVCIGQWRHREQFQRPRGEAVLRDDVLRKRLPGQGIVNSNGVRGKIAPSLRRRQGLNTRGAGSG